MSIIDLDKCEIDAIIGMAEREMERIQGCSVRLMVSYGYIRGEDEEKIGALLFLDGLINKLKKERKRW